MKTKTALVIHNQEKNRQSYNALLGSLEGDPFFDNLSVFIFKKEEEVHQNAEEILENHPNVVFAVSFSSVQIWPLAEELKRFRKSYTEKAVFIAGGPHPTGDPLGTLRMGFDLVFIGEAEESIRDFFRVLDEGGDYRSIKGTAYLKTENLITNPRRELADLNLYQSYSIRYHQYNSLEITRGCPFGCSFCQTSRLFGGHVRHRSPNFIARCIRDYRKNQLPDIRIITPDAFAYGSEDGKTIRPDRVEALLSTAHAELGKTGRLFFGSFPSEVRPEHVTPEMLALVSRFAPHGSIVIGGQSGSSRLLEHCHRGHGTSEILNAARLTAKMGFKTYIDFIFGLPGETEDDIRETIALMKELTGIGAKIHSHYFLPLPGTPFYEQAEIREMSDYEETVRRLTPFGMLSGSWRIQKKLAEKLIRYRDTGVIE